MESLALFLIGVIVVSFVGHHVWLLLAAVAKAVTGGSESVRVPQPMSAACAGCGRALLPREATCLRCNLRQDGGVAAELRELDVTVRNVRMLVARRELEQETAEILLDRVAQRRDTLLGRRKATRPVPVAAPVPHVLPVDDDIPILEMVPEVPEPVRVRPAALDRISPPKVSAPASTPTLPPKRRSWNDVLAGFMEDRNILWGELVGGLLIVGCSAALVVTLWQKLELIPYFPFLILSGISLALFGAGHYTLHHWKLESTSRGLLVIATLLLPLNLLVLAGLSRGREGGILEAATTAAGLAAFTFMAAGAGRVLAPGARWLLALGVVGAAASQLLIPRLQDRPALWLFLLPAWLTVACHCLAVGGRLWGLRREGPLGPGDVHPLLLFLGTVAFSAVVAFGFLLSRAPDLRQALQFLALPLAVGGVPALTAGLLLQRRLGEAPPSEEDTRALGGLRATATAVALGGTLILLGSVALAWPNPAMLLGVCALDAAVLTFLAFRERMPFVHAAVLPCLVLGFLATFHLDIPAVTASEMFSPRGGAALAVLVVLLAGMAELLVRTGLRSHALCYASGAVCTGALSLFLVGREGFGQPLTVALLGALYGATALLANVRWQHQILSYAGQLLLLFATLWGLQAVWPGRPAVWGVLLALEALVLATAAAWRGHWGLLNGVGDTPPEQDPAPWHRVLTSPCHNVACLAGLLATLLALTAPDCPAAWGHAVTAFVLAATTLLLVWVNGVSFGTWFGAAFLWAGLTHLLAWDLPEDAVARPWLVSLLACSSLLLLARLLLARLVPDGFPDTAGHRAHALFTVPFDRIALVGSLLALPVMLAAAWGLMLPLAGYVAWLAVLWLTFACVERSRGWMTAFQGALSAAMLLASAAWIERQPWGSIPVNLADPQTLHVLGIGLGLLGLVWVLLRLALRDHELAEWLLEPPWPAWDRVVLAGLVLGQLALAVGGLWPGIVRELTPGGPAVMPTVFGPAAWLLLALLALVLGIALQDRTVPATFGLMLLALTVPILAAGYWDRTGSAATALRYGLGVALLVCSALLWLRVPLRQLAERVGIDTRTRLPINVLLQTLVIGFTVFPVVALTVLLVGRGLAGQTLTGPVGNILPLGLIGVGLLGYALLERSAGYAFAAGWSVNLAASLVVCHLPGLGVSGRWVSFFQVNVLAWAGVACLWLLADECVRIRQDLYGSAISLLKVQSLLGLGVGSVLLLAPLVTLVVEPGFPLAPELSRIGQPLGWLAGVLASVSALWFGARRAPRLFVSLLGMSGLCLGVVAAFAVERGQSVPWLSYHVLTACWMGLGTGAAILLVSARGALWDALDLRRWVEGLGLALVVLGLRAGWDDPLRPYATAGPVLLAALMTGTLALRWRRLEHVYLSGLLMTLAGVLGWVAWGPRTLESFTLTVSLSLAVAGTLWTLAELLLATRFLSRRVPDLTFPFPYAATTAALALLAAVVFAGVLATLTGESFRVAGGLAWAALLLTTLALTVALWDRHARFAPAGLFATGLVAIALLLQVRPLTAEVFCRLAAPALAGYLLLSAVLVLSLPHLSGFFTALRLPATIHNEPPRRWFLPTQALLACVVAGLSVWVSLWFATPAERLAGPLAVALLVSASLFLLPRAALPWTGGLRCAVLSLAALACVEVGWALRLPATAAGLHHTAVCVFVLSLLALVYRDGLRGLSLENVWRLCGSRMAVPLGGLAALALLVLLGQELKLYDKLSKHTPLSGIEVALVVLSVLTQVYLALRAAVAVPADQPVGWRTLHVYGSELLLVLLLVHLKLNVPAMFGSWGAKYWTLMVMALAYVGVGMGEYFQRRNLPVLAGPLQRTGLFLPLLPLLVFWLRPPAAVLATIKNVAPGFAPLLVYLDKLPWAFQSHALLWFMLSVLYLLVSLSRGSSRFALLAALAANFGLWSLMAHFQVGFLLHPQMWLIPLALIVLVSEHLNRDRLTHELRLTLRYVGLSMIYVSSTADLFIAGLGSSAVLPVVLALLAVLGVLCGILLRVRAFLLMGLTFLALDVFAMIWHAAVDRTQTWVWYVSGIVLGGAILALFAVFEKRRNDVLRLLEEIKRWD